MYLPNKLYEILYQCGYKDTENIADFWFSNRNDIAIEVKKEFRETMMHTFENQIRWKSLIGIECQKEVRHYLEQRIQQINQAHQTYSTVSAAEQTINFSSFVFTYNGQAYTLDDFQNHYANPKISPHDNLMGIDLSGINMHNCIIENVCFADANLTDAKIGSVIFKNSTLTRAILINARLGQVRFRDGSLTGANLSGAYLNVVPFNDDNVETSFKYSTVSYLYLIKCLLSAIFLKGIFHENPTNKHAHTIFLFNDTTGLTSPYNVAIKNYIDWYQYIFNKLRSFQTLSLSNKVLFSASLLFTKGWTSYSVLAINALLINLVFAFIFYLNPSSFCDYNGEFITAFYYSIVTFTTLGYGEITPITDPTKIIVILEVLLGYITLGSFVFLIGHKVKDRF